MNGPRAIWIATLSVVALYSVFFAARLQRYEGRVSSLIGFGCHSSVCWARENRSLMPDGALVYRTGGYDGQFYYFIAAGLARGELPALDAPALRLSRIGYPLLLLPAASIGPGALLGWMLLLPWLVHLFALFALYRFLSDVPGGVSGGLYASSVASVSLWPARAALAIFALNPLSLFSAGLALADGLALSLGLLGTIQLLRARSAGTMRRTLARTLTAGLLVALACLTKETMLALPLGFGVAAVLRRQGRAVAFWCAVLVPVALYWYAIRYSPLTAAGRGGLPFAGYIEFLETGAGLAGGRGLLALLLPLYILLGLLLAGLARSHRNRGGAVDPLALAGVLGVSTLLISFATADEYWANFANISRFFLPGLLPLALAPAAIRLPDTSDETSDAAGWIARGLRLGLAGLAVFLVLFSLSLLYAESRAAPLPYDSMGALSVVLFGGRIH